jgi:hypothetical protein
MVHLVLLLSGFVVPQRIVSQGLASFLVHWRILPHSDPADKLRFIVIVRQRFWV